MKMKIGKLIFHANSTGQCGRTAHYRHDFEYVINVTFDNNHMHSFHAFFVSLCEDVFIRIDLRVKSRSFSLSNQWCHTATVASVTASTRIHQVPVEVAVQV